MPAQEMTVSLFRPPQVIPYQVHDIAKVYLAGSGMAVWDTGVGKTALAIGLTCIALEREDAEHILIVCEPNKLDDWQREFARFSAIPSSDVAVYHGPRRKKLLDALPRVLITTYETARQDAVIFRSALKYDDGPLTVALRGRRLVIAYDEVSKLGNRSSKLYKAHFRMLERLRKENPATKILGLTGTPMEGGGYEQFYNEMRIIAYDQMPKVAEWQSRCIKYRNEWGQPVYDREGIEWFRARCAPLISRRRKSDPEVREHFPPFTERFDTVTMHADQRAAYQHLEDLAWDEGTFRQVPGLSVLLRQLAGDPLALGFAAKHGDSPLAKMAWDVMGAQLEKCSSAKAEYLRQGYIDPILAAGNKLVVFTFYGQTVLPALASRLDGLPVITYHGGMTRLARDEAITRFKTKRGGAILLASDAASKGLNLPEASYVIEYEVGRTHATRVQRSGRGHRLGQADPLTFVSLVLDGTAESTRSVPKLLERNAEQDFMLSDTGADGYTTADDRWQMFAMSRKRKAPACA